ncbi:MAG: hypothetical protein ABL995_17685 [Bryobacteraceae bacterium]
MKQNLQHLLRSPGAVSQALGQLPAVKPSPEMRTRLQVVASRERQRRMARRDLRARLTTMWDRFDLVFQHLLRPFAVPFAGGVSTAVALFVTCVVPAYPLRTQDAFDVPTVLFTQVALKGSAAFNPGGEDVVVDVNVDGQGKMIDYAIVSGAAIRANVQLRRRLENVLVFTEFTPATVFGQPTRSKMRMMFTGIDVKG